jgi:peptide chain release factor 2
LETLTAAPDFWQNADAAKSLLRERTQVVGVLDAWNKERRGLDDALALVELAEEAQDAAAIAEAQSLLEATEKSVAALELSHMLRGEADFNNAILSINAGAGGTDSCDWANMLLRMYLRWAERRGFRVQVLDQQPGDEAGIRSATLLMEGPYAFGFAKAESGVHRLVRISPFDANKRRHTSFASVYVLPEVDENVEIDLKDDDLKVETMRAGGAGGQHVNVTDSAVRITHIPTGIVVQCQNERSQHRNRASAMKVLKARLYERQLEEQRAKVEALSGEKKDNAWGSQIRSYVIHPYQLVKDHRTNLEKGDVEAVLDGDLDFFVEGYLATGMKS